MIKSGIVRAITAVVLLGALAQRVHAEPINVLPYEPAVIPLSGIPADSSDVDVLTVLPSGTIKKMEMVGVWDP